MRIEIKTKKTKRFTTKIKKHSEDVQSILDLVAEYLDIPNVLITIKTNPNIDSKQAKVPFETIEEKKEYVLSASA